MLRSQLLNSKHDFEPTCGRKHRRSRQQNQEGNQNQRINKREKVSKAKAEAKVVLA